MHLTLSVEERTITLALVCNVNKENARVLNIGWKDSSLFVQEESIDAQVMTFFSRSTICKVLFEEGKLEL